MSLAFKVVTGSLKTLTRLLCRVDDRQLDRVPRCGPLILVSNHVNFLEVPLMFTHLQPRPVTGFAKAETWRNPLMAPLFNLWGGIPLHRGEADVSAIKQGVEALSQGKILAVAPEGTRSGDGCLQRARPGIVILALHSGAPLLPLVYYGGEKLYRNLSRLRRTDFHIVVGHPFYIKQPSAGIHRSTRQQIADEIMYQLAALLPAEYRGAYADLSLATMNYLVFLPP